MHVLQYAEGMNVGDEWKFCQAVPPQKLVAILKLKYCRILPPTKISTESDDGGCSALLVELLTTPTLAVYLCFFWKRHVAVDMTIWQSIEDPGLKAPILTFFEFEGWQTHMRIVLLSTYRLPKLLDDL